MSNQQNRASKRPNTQLMVKIAMLSAISFILTIEGIFRFRLPFFPAFLAMDIADVPALIGAIAIGPVAGIWILALRNVISVLITGTASLGIGPLANFIFGVAYILPLWYIYNRFGRNTRAFVAGAAVGTVVSTIMAALLNYYMIIPAFALAMGMERIIQSGADANEGINSVGTMVLYAIIPFNLIKNVLVSVVGFVLYKAFGNVIAAIFKRV